MKILITGGAGFIGSHIVEHYQERAEEIRVLDNLRTGYRHNLDGLRHTFIQGSITDRNLVKKAVEGVDYGPLKPRLEEHSSCGFQDPGEAIRD